MMLAPHFALRGRLVRKSFTLLGPCFRILRQSSNISAANVPVISYHDGERHQSRIICHSSSPPPLTNLKRNAAALRADVIAGLTPTLRKFTIQDKVAVITGGSRGLGFNMAQALAESGARGIAILDVKQDLGDVAAAELSSETGIDVRFYNVDVRDEKAVSKVTEDIVNHFGRIDILVSSAGIADSNIPAEVYDADMFRRLLDINVTGTFLAAKACAQVMIQRRTGGSMIFVASMSGTVVNYPQEQCCYNASKAAVMQLTKSLAAEWAKHGIRVNSISPGYMDTDLNRAPALEEKKRTWMENTPQKRLGNVDELNNLAVFLASDGSTYMTGSNCIIDGGYTLW